MMKEHEHLKCEGNCINLFGEHSGDVYPVIVTDDSIHKRTYYFNYCQAAIDEDRQRGFTVEVLTPQ